MHCVRCSMVFRGLVGIVLRLDVVAVGSVSVMAGLMMIAGLSVFSSLQVVFCRLLVMIRRQVMMFGMGMIAHGMTSCMISSDAWRWFEPEEAYLPRRPT